MIDTSYAAQCGTPKQHSFICFLASKAGYKRLRDFIADYMGCSVSKAGRITVTVQDASGMIDRLKKASDA